MARIAVWDTLPTTFGFVQTYLRKGDRVFVEGEIEYRSFEDRDGLTRWLTEIRAADVLAAGVRNRTEEEPKPAAKPRSSRGGAARKSTTAAR